MIKFEKFPKLAYDPRVKRRSFSWLRFFTIFLILLSLAVGQTLIVLKHYGNTNIIPPLLLNSIIWYWAIVAAIYSWIATVSIRFRYEKPMRKISNATRQVASGDFSVQLHPQHGESSLDYMDVAFLDFNKMVQELSSIEILKNDFVSNVSHEIKTPLAVIQNYATLLQSDALTKEQHKEYSQVIFGAAEQLSVLVTNVLRLSKLENQTITQIPKAYDVCGQLDDCILSFADQLEQKQIDFSAETEDKAMVMADESLVEIIWNNLLSNAIKFTKPGGKITLTQTSNNDSIIVSLRDNGCGMDEETVKHIFEKFYQGDTSHRQQGNGLGLALVKRVIDLIGGEIAVTSELHKGTTFTVIIRRAANAPIQSHCSGNDRLSDYKSST